MPYRSTHDTDYCRARCISRYPSARFAPGRRPTLPRCSVTPTTAACRSICATGFRIRTRWNRRVPSSAGSPARIRQPCGRLTLPARQSAVSASSCDTDVERVSAEIGYWIGESFWGRGIATAALTAVTAEAFKRFEITRLYALPFADHAASVRVLEKAGYVREGHLRQSAIKDGKIRDQLLFAAYRTL